MARIRTIKPEFFTSEDIVSLSPMARLFYVALWCEADREGRMQWKPKTFKMRYFPADDCDINALCEEITNAGLVCLYGDGLAYIPSFAKHQHVNPRESVSTIPPPSGNPTISRVSDASAPVSDAQVGREGREGKGREGKAREDAKPPPAARSLSRKTAMPNNFAISDRVRAWAKEKGYSQLEAHFESFVGKVKAKGYAYIDWDEAFMGAIRDNWAKLAPTVQQVAAARKPDRFELANIEFERKEAEFAARKLAAKLTGAPA